MFVQPHAAKRLNDKKKKDAKRSRRSRSRRSRARRSRSRAKREAAAIIKADTPKTSRSQFHLKPAAAEHLRVKELGHNASPGKENASPQLPRRAKGADARYADVKDTERRLADLGKSPVRRRSLGGRRLSGAGLGRRDEAVPAAPTEEASVAKHHHRRLSFGSKGQRPGAASRDASELPPHEARRGRSAVRQNDRSGKPARSLSRGADRDGHGASRRREHSQRRAARARYEELTPPHENGSDALTSRLEALYLAADAGKSGAAAGGAASAFVLKGPARRAARAEAVAAGLAKLEAEVRQAQAGEPNSRISTSAGEPSNTPGASKDGPTLDADAVSPSADAASPSADASVHLVANDSVGLVGPSGRAEALPTAQKERYKERLRRRARDSLTGGSLPAGLRDARAAAAAPEEAPSVAVASDAEPGTERERRSALPKGSTSVAATAHLASPAQAGRQTRGFIINRQLLTKEVSRSPWSAAPPSSPQDGVAVDGGRSASGGGTVVERLAAAAAAVGSEDEAEEAVGEAAVGDVDLRVLGEIFASQSGGEAEPLASLATAGAADESFATIDSGEEDASLSHVSEEGLLLAHDGEEGGGGSEGPPSLGARRVRGIVARLDASFRQQDPAEALDASTDGDIDAIPTLRVAALEARLQGKRRRLQLLRDQVARQGRAAAEQNVGCGVLFGRCGARRGPQGAERGDACQCVIA
jgi:hypothetical protein